MQDSPELPLICDLEFALFLSLCSYGGWICVIFAGLDKFASQEPEIET